VSTRCSHSRVESFNRCPFKYRLRYIEGLDTIPNTEPDNALILGTALHTGIEEGIDQALDFYAPVSPF
jgi:ATP-dependent helicase/DNAse subunit B